jgi:hypothetical protein
MESRFQINVLLFSALVASSTVACQKKERPTSESAPIAETKSAPKAEAPAPPTTPGPSGAKLTAAECAKVIDHVLDVTANEALDDDGAKLSPAERKKQLAALRTELASQPELKKQAESCDEEYSRSEYACMMAATTGDAIDKCNESPN